MEAWSHQTENGKRKMKAKAIFLNLFTVCLFVRVLTKKLPEVSYLSKRIKRTKQT